MSRTYRRKNAKKWWHVFNTEEEFNEARDARARICKTPVVIPYPNRDYRLIEPRMTNYEAAKKEFDVYYAQYKTQEYYDFCLGRRYSDYGLGKADYASYLKASMAIRVHSDCGYSTRDSLKRIYSNMFFHRPLRRAHKADIRRGIVLDEDCEVVLTNPLSVFNKWYFF